MNESTTHSRRGHLLVSPLQREVASLVPQRLSVQVRVKRDKCPCCTQSVASARRALWYSLPCSRLLALSGWGDTAPLHPWLFLNNPLLQALGLVEEKPGKHEHRYQHEGAQHHQPHVAAVGKRGCSGLLRGDHVGQVQHVAQGPACITAANLEREKSRIRAGRCKGSLWHCRGGSSPCSRRARLYCRRGNHSVGQSPPRHKPYLSKEVDPLPVLFIEFIAIFQEREDVGPREAIFTQVLLFYLVICLLYLGREGGRSHQAAKPGCHSCSLHLSFQCRCWGEHSHTSLGNYPHPFILQHSTSSSGTQALRPAAEMQCSSPRAKAGRRSSEQRWPLCPGQRGYRLSGSKSSSQSRKQKKPEGERIL